MKLLVFVVLITVWVTIIAKKSINRLHGRDNFNVTHSSIDLHGTLRRSFFLLSVDSELRSHTLCSPLSALLPLAKLALGAEGNSSDELLDAIGVSKKSKIKEYYTSLLTQLRNLPGVKLNIASRLYMSHHAHLQHDFKEAAEKVFQSSVEKIDFTSPTYAAEEINSWLSIQTNGIIDDILESSDISPSTSIILVNAIYFNGRWTKPFETVSDVEFHNSMRGLMHIEMMMREDVFHYTKSEDLAAQIISIPYSGGNASLVVVYPEADDGLPALLALLQLTVDKLAEAMLAMKPTHLKFTMPKFTLHSELDLETIYTEMGLKTIFNKAQSGLTKMVRDETVYISKAKHKCFIDVNEYGTEAAASSVVNMANFSYLEPLGFLVDHPFLYFILVNDQQLFSGTFVDPAVPF